MAIRHIPTGDVKHYDLIRFFRPSGSRTLVWALDVTRDRLLRILRWGNELYLPVYDGMKLGIGIYNGNSDWRAYPGYFEALNMWDGGQPQPEDCDTDHMWELAPGLSQVFDAFMNPNAQVGRPFIITATGFGNTIGEATFGTTAFHGQVRIYERLAKYSGGLQSYRRTNEGHGTDDIMLGGSEWRGGTTRGFGGTPKGINMNDGHAGIGLGAEEYRSHMETGITYQRDTQPVVFFRVEFQKDLQPMLDIAWGNTWDWYEPIPAGNFWWEDPWDWHKPTAPQVPTIRPHDPKR